MGGRSRWSRRIARRGMRSFRGAVQRCDDEVCVFILYIFKASIYRIWSFRCSMGSLDFVPDICSESLPTAAFWRFASAPEAAASGGHRFPERAVCMRKRVPWTRERGVTSPGYFFSAHDVPCRTSVGRHVWSEWTHLDDRPPSSSTHPTPSEDTPFFLPCTLLLPCMASTRKPPMSADGTLNPFGMSFTLIHPPVDGQASRLLL
jgi:hypothetical protein